MNINKFTITPKTKMAAANKSCVPRQRVLSSRQIVHPSRVSKLPLVPKKVKCVSIGQGQCVKCTIGDLKNMIKCDWCNLWLHADCIGLNLEQLKTLIDIQPKNNVDGFPFQCKSCYILMSSQWGTILNLFKRCTNQMQSNRKWGIPNK